MTDSFTMMINSIDDLITAAGFVEDVLRLGRFRVCSLLRPRRTGQTT